MSKPSQAQIEAGNYKKRHVRFQGLDIAIENPKGSVRSGVDRGGKAWSIKMHADYGYVNGSMGVDGDQVDVFIGPQADAETVYIVTTMSPPNFIKRDENKCMLGYGSAAEAKSAFLAHYDDKRFFGSMLSMPVDEFKAKVLATKDKPAMIKAHVSGYRRDDGAYVRPYETKRPERKKRYPNKQTAQAMAVLDDIKDGRREALRELCGPKLDVLLVSIHASNKRVRDLVDQTSQPSESLADATLEALSGMQPEKLVRLHGWNDLIAHIRTTLRALVIYLRQTNMHAAADWLQWRVGEWTDEDIGRLLLRADAKLTKGMDMDAIGRMLGDFGKAAPTVLFLKAHVPQHTRVVNGRTVVVSSYDNKVVGGPKETRHKPDPFTLDLFGEAAGKQQDAEKLPTRDVRIGDELKIDGEIYHVTRGIKGGVLAERKVSAFQTSSRMLYGDDVIRAKIAAETHTMPKQEAIAEHERLVDVLNSPSHADDKAEAKKQAKELAEMKTPAPGIDHEAEEKYRIDMKKMHGKEHSFHTRLDATDREIEILKNSDSHFSSGYVAFKDGKERALPSYYTTNKGKNPRSFYSGWDAAKEYSESPEGMVVSQWNKAGVPISRQRELLRQIADKSAPGAKVGPFTVGANPLAKSARILFLS